jgi:hypothetical protein
MSGTFPAWSLFFRHRPNDQLAMASGGHWNLRSLERRFKYCLHFGMIQHGRRFKAQKARLFAFS